MKLKYLTGALFGISILFSQGCSTNAPQVSQRAAEADSHDHAAHAHPTHGPHHGDLIELGNEEYHAELVHPSVSENSRAASGPAPNLSVTVYMLDATAKQLVAIDSTEIIVNLKSDGRPLQFKLTALPTEEDSAGQSSRFSSQDKSLVQHFSGSEHAAATLVVEIEGKSYRGSITHTHDHSAHEHVAHAPHDEGTH